MAQVVDVVPRVDGEGHQVVVVVDLGVASVGVAAVAEGEDIDRSAFDLVFFFMSLSYFLFVLVFLDDQPHFILELVPHSPHGPECGDIRGKSCCYDQSVDSNHQL